MYRFSNFTDTANDAMNIAFETAGNMGHTFVGTEHILLGLLKTADCVACRVLGENSVSAEGIEAMLVKTHGVGGATVVNPNDLTARAKRILQFAQGCAIKMGHGYVGTEHLLIALLGDEDSYAYKFIIDEGGDVNSIRTDILKAVGSGEQIDEPQYDDSDEEYEESQRGMSPFASLFGNGHTASREKDKKTKSSTKTLDKYGRDLTAEAKKGELDPVIGRDVEIDRVIQILSRRTKNNPCLIGEPGVGKTAIAEGLALKIASGDIAETLRDKRIVSLDLSSMVAGTKYRGDFEERIKEAIEEVNNVDNVILFIDEIHTIIGAGAAEGATDAANILKPQLARGKFRVIGATTIEEYRKHIEKDAALERRFQPVMVGEPSEEDSILILKGLRDRYEAHHGLAISDEAIEAAVKLSVRYIADRYLPDKAIDLIDEAASRVRLTRQTQPDELRELEAKLKSATASKEEAVNSQQYEKAATLRDNERRLKEQLEKLRIEWKDKARGGSAGVGAEDIAAVVSQWTGIPVTRLTQEESERMLNMESILHQRIVGQDDAVKAVSRAIRRGRVGLKDPNRPVGSFIFLGPTGVGKTELCKALAEAMFGDENSMIRLDMSEYMEKHTTSKLIGSPPGYVGYDEGGQLTEKIRRHPYSVVLFDEIEKAHPDVFNTLLQILEDGRITDSQGRTVSFKNSVIIMTSNVGAQLISENRQSLGFGGDKQDDADFDRIKELVTGELKKTFKPEFLNRVDDIIVFHKLGGDDITKIAEKMLDTLGKRMRAVGISLRVNNGVAQEIAKEGCDPVYGARPLRRAIMQKLEDPLSELLLDGTLKAGDAVLISFDGEKFVFTK